MNDPIVSRECEVGPPSGISFRTKTGVMPPMQRNGKWWECKLSLPGILEEERIAFGVDEWDSLQMGMQMVWIELDHKPKTGWNFSWWNGECSGINQLLPQWGRELHPQEVRTVECDHDDGPPRGGSCRTLDGIKRAEAAEDGLYGRLPIASTQQLY